jgi:chromosome segregation ATPase
MKGIMMTTNPITSVPPSVLQNFNPLPLQVLPQTPRQVLVQAKIDAQDANLIALHNVQQCVDRLKTAFDAVLQENIQLRQENEVLKGAIQTQNRIYDEKLQSLTNLVETIRQQSLENAQHVVKVEQSIPQIEKKFDEFKERYNNHTHTYMLITNTWGQCIKYPDTSKPK